MIRRLKESFNNAIEGVIYAIRTQRNMKIHIISAVIVLIASALFSISKGELILILLLIGIVFITEMFNTAIELSLNLVVDTLHPVARIIKDVSAGAVLFSSITAIVIGYLIFMPKIKGPMLNIIVRVQQSPEHVALIAIILTVIAVVVTKAFVGRGLPLSGGMPSGHTAVSFCIWAYITLITINPLISILLFIPVMLVAISRIRGGVHSIGEVIAGGLLGLGLGIGAFWILAGMPFFERFRG
ncbi:MAG: diacylglycerol kinase [bacterium]